MTPAQTLQEDFTPPVSKPSKKQKKARNDDDSGSYDVAEVIIFTYGVVVFFGLAEFQERAILEDLENAGMCSRPIPEDDFEIEECHFEVRILRLCLQSGTLISFKTSMMLPPRNHGYTTIFSVSTNRQFSVPPQR